MFERRPSSSILSHNKLKRQCPENETDCVPKKSKFDESNVSVKTELDVEEVIVPRDRRQANKTIASLILCDQKRNVQIYPSQIVWCRSEKCSFWPAMVWSSKTGKLTDNKQRVLVKFFAKKGANVWMKMTNIFPFDGLESFERMKNSVDVHLMTKSMRRDYDFAFNITSDVWPRAVAEAIYCLSKDREERLSLFVAFLSSSKLQKRRKDPLQRRSLELNISNSCQVKAFRVNDEIHSVQSFINDISFSKAETSSNPEEEEIETYEEKLLEFVTESLVSSKFSVGVDKICNFCLSSKSAKQLVKCAGACDGYLHRNCFGNRTTPQRLGNRGNEGASNNLPCDDCTDKLNSFCFVCKTQSNSSQSEAVNCKVPDCLRRYHVNCLENWPQAKWNASNQDLICPVHECRQCGSHAAENEAKLTTCIKCPTAVHSKASCIHAGTIILSESQHICTKHRQQREATTNLDYCYICKIGCNLLRCQICPHSYHESCSPSASTSTCAKCLNGQHPIYGDIVWAKLYTYAWWPAIIVPPQCVPPNIRSDKHLPFDMCVCFFGDHSYAWIDRQSVHPFDEDNFVLFTETGNKFCEAIASARKWYSQAKIIKIKKQTELAASTSNASTDDGPPPPQPYTNISENIPIAPAALFFDATNDASPCRCNVNDDPCGVTSSCVNRASYTECNEFCLSADKCGNKCIQQGKYPKVNLQYFGNKGYGLVAAEPIPCGTIVQQYTGEVITAAEYVRRITDTNRSNVYLMKYSVRNLYIDAETKGSLARYVNHSCNPNCGFHFWSVNGVDVVVIIALDDIPEGTEITCKYDWSRSIPCLCNEDNCSGFC